MPINVLSNSYCTSEKSNKIDTSLIVQQPYLRTSYIQSNIEEDNDMRNQFGVKVKIQWASEKQLQRTMLITNVTIVVK